MHHPDPAGDSGGVRKMAHSAVFHRRGSNTGGGSGGSALSTPANPVVTNSHVPADDYQPSSLLIQCQPPAGSSSPGPHHIPPQSLNLHSQAQPAQPPSSGAQIKKKSGFQITSVTPAQISVSTNNSIAEDTESYDDLDESHTEDLSSSEILDVSLSRANDVVGAERSSSEETLNNFHEADTPGAVSPNQPSHPHALNQAQQMVNGTVHHHHHHHHQHQPHPHHPNHAQGYPLSSVPGSPSPALTSGALPCVTQKMPSNKGVPQENVTQPAPASIIAQPVGVVAPGSAPGLHSSATGTTVSIINPLTSNVSNVNTLSSANVPARERIGSSASSGSGGGSFPPNVMSSGVGSTGGGGGGNLITTANVIMGQQHQNINSSITMTTTTNAAAAVSASGGMGIPSGSQGRIGSSVLQPASAPVAAAAPPAQAQPAPAPAVVPTASRFRVVKLDSSSEPFKKGRWTCTEFYDKDPPASAPSSSTSDAGSHSVRQFASDSFAGACERDSTSGSSVSSTVSTLSHYNEVASGVDTAGGALLSQHGQDFASPPHGFQGILPSGLNMGASQIQTQMHPQDVGHSQMKTAAPPLASSNINQPAPMPSHQTSIGLSASAAQQQQLTYAQAVANQPTGSTQGLVGVKQQKMNFSSPIQQQSTGPQAAPVQVRPSEYTQPPQQGVPQGAGSKPISNPPGSAPGGATNGASQMMGALQQPLLHIQPQQPSSLQSSNLPSHVGGAPGLGQQPQGHASHLDCQQQQQKPQSLPTQIQNQGLGTQLPNTVHQSQVSAPSVPPPNTHGDPQVQPPQASSGRMPSQGVPQSQQPCATLARDPSSTQALAYAAQASALYASLPTFTTTQLQDAERLLLQHQSALLGLTKLSGGEAVTGSSGAVQGQDAEGNATATSALSAAAGIKTVDGEEDG